jgi:hypothetical protein
LRVLPIASYAILRFWYQRGVLDEKTLTQDKQKELASEAVAAAIEVFSSHRYSSFTHD